MLRRLQSIFNGTRKAQAFREQTDLTTLSLLTEYYQNLWANPSLSTPEEQEKLFDDAVDKLEAFTPEQHQQSIQNNLHQQVLELFRLHQEAPSPSLLPPQTSDFHILPPTVDLKQLKQELHDYYKQNHGFSLHIQPSTIPDAGLGVYVNGEIPAGGICAFYPGSVLMKDHLRKRKYLERVMDNPYARARPDQTIIDASKLLAKEGSVPTNYFACGHMINHPDEGTQPNVVAAPYDFPQKDPFIREQQDFVPNKYVERPSIIFTFGKNILVQSIVLIATRNIKDEELLLNYRYNPAFESPEWYHSVDAQADRELWGV